MQDANGIRAALEQLFPADTAVIFSASCPAAAELLAGELPATGRMVDKRRQEFTHGRLCARAALQKLGFPAVAIPQGNNREPVWPTGIVGSISHTDSAAAAVAASSNQLAGIGLDMEPAEPLNEDLIEMICRADEEVGKDGAQAKLLFSIKEAIYKCIYPSVREYVDFQEMKVNLDRQSQSFTATAFSTRCEPELINRLEGRFCFIDGLVLSSAWLRI